MNIMNIAAANPNNLNRRGYIKPDGLETAAKNELPPLRFNQLMIDSMNAIIKSVNKQAQNRKRFTENVSMTVAIAKHFSAESKLAMATLIADEYNSNGWNCFVSFDHRYMCISIGDRVECSNYELLNTNNPIIVAKCNISNCIFNSHAECSAYFCASGMKFKYKK